MKTKYLWYCPQCHCTDVQVKAWIKPNCNDHVVDTDAGEETGWCPNCEEHLSLEFETLESILGHQTPENIFVWVDDVEECHKSGIAIFYKSETNQPNPKSLVEIIGSDKLTWHYSKDVYFLPNKLVSYGWKCTDSDNHQYCQQINDTTFRYKEFDWFNYPQEFLDENMLTVEGLFNKGKYWVESDIELSDYSDKEIQENISAYYEDLDELKTIYGDNWKQIVCECIFEQESGLY